MKNRILFTFALLSGFAALQADSMWNSPTWKDFVRTAAALGKATKETVEETGSFIKSNSWDAKVGSCKNGGKVIIISIATLILADQAYHWYVNKKIKAEFEKQKQQPAQPVYIAPAPAKKARGA